MPLLFSLSLPLVLLLATNFSASPARIALLIGQTEAGIQVGPSLVEKILNFFGIRWYFTREQVQCLLQKESEENSAEMSDATADTLVEILTMLAKDLGRGYKFQAGIRILFLASNGLIPYFQILLFSCTVDQFSDHPPEFLYTFKPRGTNTAQVWNVFPPELAPAGNPYLNNFKAVWAESRPDNKEQARALVVIIDGLSSLPYSPRRELSSEIRKAILRYI